MRNAVNEFRVRSKVQLSRLDGGAKEDLQRKYANLLAFDFEAAARLKAWDDIGQIVKV